MKPLLSVLTSLFLCFSINLAAQDWGKIKKIDLQKEVSCYSVDIAGNFYLGFKDGGLMKYNERGDFLENYSLSNKSAITLIDVQNNLKPFLFYLDNQQIAILDRFATVPKVYDLAGLGIQFAMIACPAPDGDIWVVENNPQRLKKINPQRNNLVLELQLNLGDSILKMQAYQNLLVVANTKAIIVLDQFGGILYKLSVPELLNFQLQGDLLSVLSSSKITTHKLFTGEATKTKPVPFVSAMKGVFKSNYHLGIVSSKKSITLYK